MYEAAHPYPTGYMRWLIAAACSVLLCACTRAPEVEDVRIMTYNIHHGEDLAGELSLPRIAALIREHDVDVVALQEVDSHWAERSAFADQPQELAELLGMEVFYAPIYDRPADRLDESAAQPEEAQRRRYGLAVLSRYPIVAKANHELTRIVAEGDTTKLPGFPAVTLEVGDVHLHVFNTHLDYRPDPAVRRIEIAEMLGIIDATEGPRVLLGDLNARPEAAELDTLLRRFADAWSLRGTGDGFTFPSDAPDRRIDYILVSEDIKVDSVAVLESAASDHRPLVAQLSIQPSAYAPR